MNVGLSISIDDVIVQNNEESENRDIDNASQIKSREIEKSNSEKELSEPEIIHIRREDNAM